MKKMCVMVTTPALTGTPAEVKAAERIRGRVLAAVNSEDLVTGWQLLHDIVPAVWWLRHADDDPEQLLRKAADAISSVLV